MRKVKAISFTPEYYFVMEYLFQKKNASKYIIDLVIADMKIKGLNK